MKTPQLLEPMELSNKVLAGRYRKHPGPYSITSGWHTDLSKIFPEIETTGHKFHDVPSYGEMGQSETELLYYLVRWMEPRVLVEFGTFYGKSTRLMAEQSPENARILTVDLPDGVHSTRNSYSTDTPFMELKDGRVGHKYEDLPYDAREKITQRRMDATTPEFTRSLDDFLNGEKINFALVDASHDYETTKHIFEEVALPRMSSGGVILLDDYGRLTTQVGVTAYLVEKARKDGFLFYHFKPDEHEYPSAVIFVNLPGAKSRNWRQTNVE